jgi:CRP/FNR family transcriptional regulator, anaerobic regulatory protein
MIDDASCACLLREYPAVASIEPTLRADVLSRHMQWLEVPAGTLLFDEGHPCRGFPLVASGEVRVARGTPQGRALELYRVQRGELCVASTAGIVGAQPMQAHGITTRDSALGLLSSEGFERWCAAPSFRRFVFGVFAERLSELMALVEAVAFQRLDQRLAAALLAHGTVVHSTHQALAEQLGTAREIVTRLLRRFEIAGMVRLARERIEVVDAAALRTIAEPPQHQRQA